MKLVESELVAVVKHFGFDKWTKGGAVIDLGGRELTPYPIPGHQEASIAVSDPHTQWLLTGDTFTLEDYMSANGVSTKSASSILWILRVHTLSLR